MVKSFFISALILLCTALTEATIFSNITLLPAIPDLSLLCVVYIALQNGRLMGEAAGFVSGLFLDFLSAGPFGLNCLIRTVVGFLSGLFTKTINTDGFFVSPLLGCAATILKALLLWAISFLFPFAVVSYTPISWNFLWELGINTVLCPFLYQFLSLFKKSLVLRPEEVY